MIRFLFRLLGALFAAATMGTIAGALILAGVFTYYSKGLPSYDSLSHYAPPTISRIYSGEGAIIDEFAKERRLFVPIEDMPDLVKHAFIAAEDQHFYTHPGFDITGVIAALRDYIVSRGKEQRGASTIPQQVVKNFLLDGGKNYERKIRELILSVRLVQAMPKDKILELYLNEIFLGQNSYGVAAAAQTYFNKTLDQLTPGEAAYLAALPKEPSNLNPVTDYQDAVDRRGYVLGRMAEDGYITPDVAKSEQALPLRTVQNGDYPSFRQALPPRGYFTDEIRRQLSSSFGEDEFFAGGLTIRATVDPSLQEQAAAALRQGLEKYDRGQGVWHGVRGKIDPAKLTDAASWRAALSALTLPRDIPGWHVGVVLAADGKSATVGIEGQDDPVTIPASDVTWARPRLADGSLGKKAKGPADLVAPGDVVLVAEVTEKSDTHWSLRQVPTIEGGFMAMDVNTGRVLAMQGGFSYQDSVFNRATQATRQPGSSFKPFVYAAALDNGFTPGTIVVDAPIAVETAEGIWTPKNASDKYYGPTPLRTGIEQSRNLMTVRVAQQVGMETVARYAEKFGVYDPMNPFLANALGAQETTLFKMVAAYAMFANGGERVEPTLVDRVQDRYGRTIYRHDNRLCEDCRIPELRAGAALAISDDRERVMDAITAYQLTSMLQGVVLRGTARGAIHLPVPVAGKTGTTNDAKDVWFIGFTSNIVAGCYMGFDQPKTLGGGASGGGLCGPVFQSFMEKAIQKYGGGPFRVPPGGHFVKLDRYTGAMLADDATGDNVQPEYFRDGEDGLVGMSMMVDGGFAMGANLPLFKAGESDGSEVGDTVTTATGGTVVIPKKADYGTLSSGGLY